MAQPSTEQAPLKVNSIDPDHEPSMNRFLDGIAASFSNTMLSRAFITEIDNTPPPYPSPSINGPRIRRHLTPGITDGAHSGAELVEAGDFSALALWETTSYRGVPFTDSLRNVGPIRGEWRTKVRQCKEKYIGLETKGDGKEDFKPFYHLGFLARNPDQKAVPGAISAVVKPWLKRAEEEGVPVWLEATYEHAVDVYKNWGFRLVETIRIGEGSRSAEGWPEEGGEGVCGYAMIYDAHLKED
ncbi:hypothetical protein LTR70_010388 [Exophiala xenobiotica]|uniref:N-acetyltransferase domain-containing protein n=1 Tax=Lithohypha guttulata TaxID=1690604 RepID=A0ABR0K483_9EURO|nr:hypothetical protein LTR24_007006 [Lithohypha guttulata]KAK5309332.1 hypothetical protein LTR70_010388 [Exophiala xenobiotica]